MDFAIQYMTDDTNAKLFVMYKWTMYKLLFIRSLIILENDVLGQIVSIDSAGF